MCINEAETRIALATERTRMRRCQSCRAFQTKRPRPAVKQYLFPVKTLRPMTPDRDSKRKMLRF